MPETLEVFMLKCKEFVKIISSDVDQFAHKSWLELLQIRMHIFICHRCHKYVKQLKLIRNEVKNIFLDQIKNQEHSIKKIEDDVIKKMK